MIKLGLIPRLAYHDAMTYPSQPAAPAGALIGTQPDNDAGLALEYHVQRLSAAVEACLRQSGSLSELDLIRQLQAPPWQLIGTVNYADPAVLYPVHFLLFHVLYRLRDELATGGESVNISPLAISLTQATVVAGSGLPGHTDPLRDFYLDLSQYQLDTAEILRMVDDFHAGLQASRPGTDDAEQAAGVLGFKHLPSRFEDVKYRFRRAVMQAHPDRGGTTGEIQRLNEAFATLRHYFRQGETL